MLEKRLFFLALGVSAAILLQIYRDMHRETPASPKPAARLTGFTTRP